MIHGILYNMYKSIVFFRWMIRTVSRCIIDDALHCLTLYTSIYLWTLTYSILRKCSWNTMGKQRRVKCLWSVHVALIVYLQSREFSMPSRNSKVGIQTLTVNTTKLLHNKHFICTCSYYSVRWYRLSYYSS